MLTVRETPITKTLFPVLHPLCQLTMSLLRALTKCPGSTGEVRGLSRTRPPTLLAQVFYLLVAPQARCLQLLRLNLSLCKMSHSPEEDLGEEKAGSKQRLTPGRQVGSPPWSSFWSFNSLSSDQTATYQMLHFWNTPASKNHSDGRSPAPSTAMPPGQLWKALESSRFSALP